MKITKIESCQNDFIDLLLKKKIMNDYLYETNFFKVHISDIDPLDYLYRRMYEERYLRRGYNVSDIPENGKMIMKLSIAEAIVFVKAALPPVFKIRESEAYESINALKETLEAFLLDGPSQCDYIPLFKNHTGLNYFETSTEYDITRNKTLRKFTPTDPVVDFLACQIPFNELYDEGIEGDELEDYEGSLYRVPTGSHIHFVYNCIKKSELEYVYKIINESKYYYLNGLCEVVILNLTCSEFNGYFVEMYIENFDSEICKTLYDLFKSSYKSILGK